MDFGIDQALVGDARGDGNRRARPDGVVDGVAAFLRKPVEAQVLHETLWRATGRPVES